MKDMEVKVIERLFNINKKNIEDAVNGGNDYGIDPLTLIAIISLLAQIMPYIIDWLNGDPWFAKLRLRGIVKNQAKNKASYTSTHFTAKEIADTIYEVYQENMNLAAEYVGS
jgi:hypothetical protein